MPDTAARMMVMCQNADATMYMLATLGRIMFHVIDALV
jgi:hypothetical protein